MRRSLRRSRRPGRPPRTTRWSWPHTSGPITIVGCPNWVMKRCRRRSERGYSGDVIGHIRRHRLGCVRRRSVGDGGRGYESPLLPRLGKSRQAPSWWWGSSPPSADVVAGVIDAHQSGGEIRRGRVVDRIHAHRLPADFRAQRVDECMPEETRPRRLAGASGEHDLYIGARRRSCGRGGRCGRDGCYPQRRRAEQLPRHPIGEELVAFTSR